MTIINAAQAAVKTVADPNASYEALLPLWKKSRAVCSGEKYVKDFDSTIDTNTFSNLLIPFSPSMTDRQYSFYKAEAELPGIVSQFCKMLVGGLLRKQPIFSIPEEFSTKITEWIMNSFSKDDNTLSSFLDEALWEEIQTSRCWVLIDYPKVESVDNLTREELDGYKPYPIVIKAESVVNWRTRKSKYGKILLDRVIIKNYEEGFEKNEFHPSYTEVVYVHELDQDGLYQIRKFKRLEESSYVENINGKTTIPLNKAVFKEVEKNDRIFKNGERLKEIPIWPLNGSIEPNEPSILPIVDKEINLYNKISRRNHLLYGAATYTPVIFSDMSDEDFEDIVNQGLGSWLRLRQGDEAKILETPTDALKDMDRTISQSIEEMAKLGIRMLSPESAQSGVALEIRNAAQTAQLGTLNNKVSATLRQVIAFMISWRYDIEIPISAIRFSLSADFNPIPLGADWLRLATDWYQQGLIPRSTWLEILKHNDMLTSEYDDVAGQQEIASDPLLVASEKYSDKLEMKEDQ